MYADDTTLSCNLNDMNKENVSLLLNTELKHVSDWLTSDLTGWRVTTYGLISIRLSIWYFIENAKIL